MSGPAAVIPDPQPQARRRGNLRAALAAAIGSILLVLDMHAGSAQTGPKGEAEAFGSSRPAPRQAIRYDVDIEGAPGTRIGELLAENSLLRALKDRPPASLTALRRRAEEDISRLRLVLQSEGFLTARVAYRIDPETAPVDVRLMIEAGPRFTLETIEIEMANCGEEACPPTPDPAALGLELPVVARAVTIAEFERLVVSELADMGHPFARSLGRRAVIDAETAAAAARISIDPGPAATFGETAFEGLEAVKEIYLRRLLPWSAGERFSQRLVDQYRDSLLGTKLFAAVDYAPLSPPEDGTSVPLTIHAVEAEHRSIGLGATFSSSEGPGGRVFWEHRNIFNANESLRLSLNAAEIEQSAEAAFRKPRFLGRPQALTANASVVNKNTDAFDEIGVETGLGLERRFDPLWLVSLGVNTSYADLEDAQGDRQSALLSLPIGAFRDSTDDFLDPGAGTRLSLRLTPSIGDVEGGVLFLTSEIAGSGYWRILDAPETVAALRLRIGSIVGEETARLPANRRFFAGGGGSIRGFGFEEVGPSDADGNPLGGRSIFEIGAELRFRVTEEIGIVPFIEGGNVYDDRFPDFSDKLRWGAGIGFRYFTRVGPIRVDLALPINPEPATGNNLQLYISIGQAF